MPPGADRAKTRLQRAGIFRTALRSRPFRLSTASSTLSLSSLLAWVVVVVAWWRAHLLRQSPSIIVTSRAKRRPLESRAPFCVMSVAILSRHLSRCTTAPTASSRGCQSCHQYVATAGRPRARSSKLQPPRSFQACRAPERPVEPRAADHPPAPPSRRQRRKPTRLLRIRCRSSQRRASKERRTSPRHPLSTPRRPRERQRMPRSALRLPAPCLSSEQTGSPPRGGNDPRVRRPPRGYHQWQIVAVKAETAA